MTDTLAHGAPTGLEALTPGTWTVDPAHSSIGFIARHLMVTKVRGQFADFAGTITVGDDLLVSSVEAVAEVASVTTGDAGRDAHLLSADFFDVEHHPQLTFRSTGITPRGTDYVLHGELTIKGVTRPVDFDLSFDGVATDPWGNTKAGFTAETVVNRKDWGLVWNVALETGGVLVSEKVTLQLDIQAARVQ